MKVIKSIWPADSTGHRHRAQRYFQKDITVRPIRYDMGVKELMKVVKFKRGRSPLRSEGRSFDRRLV
eukprot:1611459-Pleurochrysis_carterae.AAC.5